jgi:hypothetical protein
MGGLVWHHLQYVIGLTRLGHDVYYLEDSDDYPSCYDPQRQTTDRNPDYGLQFTAQTFKKVGLGDRWAYYDAHTTCWFGPCSERIAKTIQSADLLLNLSGVNPLRPWLMEIPHRVLVDTDPVFTQVHHLADDFSRNKALQHTAFFSFGENINSDTSSIPDDHIHWLPTRQPVVTDLWPVSPGPVKGKFTTVMQWDSYSVKEYNGIEYGMKSASFGPFFELPCQSDQALELALGSEAAPRTKLLDSGWLLRNPLEVTRTPWSYQHYIQQSKAEFSVAKNGYVITHSGWFSERSTCYLASGRPVLVQETGFSEWLETGSGIIPFSSASEALSGIDEINRNYEYHCQAAREMAHVYFDACIVLPSLVQKVYEL